MKRREIHGLDEELSELARHLPDGEPDPAESAVMRRAVLFAIGRARRRRVMAWRLGTVLAFGVAGVSTAVILDEWRGERHPDAPEPGTTRIVQNTGRTTYDVAPRGPGERFLVVTPEAEVEVRGTRFTVAVEHGATSIEVAHGRVEVRERDGRVRQVLGAGQSTRVQKGAVVASTAAPAPAPTATPPPAPPADEAAALPSKASRPSPSERTVPAPTEPPRSAAELAAFRTAHELHFGRSDFAAALEAWNRYLAVYPQGSLAQEARYNRAVCLLRLGRTADADPDLSAISDSPSAFRAREARLLRGAALASDGRCEEAEAILAPLAAGSDEVARRAAALPPCRAGSE